MKERPILMTPENAQKCHEGGKTQTRRIIKPQPDGKIFHKYDGCWNSAHFEGEWICPYGVVGDRLWIREAFAWPGEEVLIYRGNPGDMDVVRHWMARENGPKVKWTPAIHMPRWACRTVLELTEVRVERLQDCSTEDAISEGAETFEGECELRDKRLTKAQLQFAALWESINGPGSWGLNPWVWVLTFKKVES